MGIATTVRTVFLSLLTLALPACDLPFGLGGDPGRQLLVTRGSDLLRVSTGSGEVEVIRRIDGTFGKSELAAHEGVLHAFVEGEGGGRYVMGLDLCTGRTVYERSFPYPEALGLSPEETLLFVYSAEGYFEVPKVTILSAGTGESLGSYEPLAPFSIRTISPGPAYPDGAVMVHGPREVTRGPDENRVFVLDPDFSAVLDSIHPGEIDGVGSLWGGGRPGVDGRSLYLLSTTSILRYDLVTRTVLNEVSRQVPSFSRAHLSIQSDGSLLVTDAGGQLNPSSGNVYLISPDLERVDTIDVGELFGDPRRPTTLSVGDRSAGRAYILSPESAWDNPQHVLLLVLDLEARKLEEIVDLGWFGATPPIFLHPGC